MNGKIRITHNGMYCVVSDNGKVKYFVTLARAIAYAQQNSKYAQEA